MEILHIFSRKIPEVDRSKPMHVLKLLAVAECLQSFRYSLLGKSFILLTDSKVISFYNSSISRTPKIETLAQINEYEFDIKHIHSSLNKSRFT